MTVIQCRRDSGAFVPPYRALYGLRNGRLVFPLDIAFTSYDPPPGAMSAPSPPILGSSVLGAGGSAIATSLQYAWPPAGSVIPAATATPTADIDLDEVLHLAPGPPALAATGTPVQVTDANDNVKSGIVRAYTTVSYLDALHTITAYQVQFSPPLFAEDHGLPVMLAAHPDVIVGMVIASAVSASGANAYVTRV